MDWTIIEKITNHPAFLAVLSILSFIGGIIAIISKTSWGKKAIAKLTDLADVTKRKVDATRDLVNTQIENINQIKEDVVSFKEDVVNEIKSYFSQLEFFEKSVYNILSQIPNAKVQEQLKVFYSQWQEKKREIQEFVGSSYTEVDSKIKELNDEKDRQISALKNEIEELKDLVNKTINVKESGENEQRKETINAQTKEE